MTDPSGPRAVHGALKRALSRVRTDAPDVLAVALARRAAPPLLSDAANADAWITLTRYLTAKDGATWESPASTTCTPEGTLVVTPASADLVLAALVAPHASRTRVRVARARVARAAADVRVALALPRAGATA